MMVFCCTILLSPFSYVNDWLDSVCNLEFDLFFLLLTWFLCFFPTDGIWRIVHDVLWGFVQFFYSIHCGGDHLQGQIGSNVL
jgi:choline-glycine betaine transporter